MVQTSEEVYGNMTEELTVFFDAAENIVHIVREEALPVQHSLYQASNCAQRHLLCVSVAVPLSIRVSVCINQGM